jgi:hypothetical protein
MNKNNKLLSFAKGENKTTQKKVDPKTPEEERDLKAKEKVGELLKDIKLTPTNEDDLLEISMPSKNDEDGVKWLTDQVAVLSEENEKLRLDAEFYQENYQKILNENQQIKSGAGIVDDSTVKLKVLELFNELQNNYMSMGFSPSGESNFRVIFPAFLERMVVFFPFLGDKRKYNIN